MKPLIFIITSLITILFINSANTQNDLPDNTTWVIQHMTNALNVYDPCHYKAQMRFKEFGGDTFEIRNFSISYKSDASNPLYGYNWEFAEAVDSGHTFTWMTLPESLYGIFSGNKGIRRYDLPKTIDLGSYLEYIRSFFVLSEVFLPFTSVPPEDIMVRDSGDSYYLTRQINDVATRELVIGKDTYLPIQSTSRFRDSAFDFVQITEVNFFYDDDIRTLPDTAFSPDHYMSLGYNLFQNKDAETSEKTEKRTISQESREFLLDYPLVTETSDTLSLRSSKAGYILLDFWYSSCVPCLHALPIINQFAEDYADEDLVVMGINCFDLGIRNNVAAKLRAKNITIPLLFGSRDLLRSLNMNSFPSYLLITPDRNVAFIEGHTDGVKKLLERIFEK